MSDFILLSGPLVSDAMLTKNVFKKFGIFSVSIKSHDIGCRKGILLISISIFSFIKDRQGVSARVSVHLQTFYYCDVSFTLIKCI